MYAHIHIHIHMRICINIHIHIYMYIYVYTDTYICLYNTRILIHIQIRMQLQIHTYIHTYRSTYTYMHTYIHTYIHVCMYVYIYIFSAPITKETPQNKKGTTVRTGRHKFYLGQDPRALRGPMTNLRQVLKLKDPKIEGLIIRIGFGALYYNYKKAPVLGEESQTFQYYFES